MLNKVINLTCISMLTLLIISCSSQTEKSPLYTPSPALNNFKQETFAAYLAETQRWLEDNRVFISNDRAQELAANMPFEIAANTDAIAPKVKAFF